MISSATFAETNCFPNLLRVIAVPTTEEGDQSGLNFPYDVDMFNLIEIRFDSKTAEDLESFGIDQLAAIADDLKWDLTNDLDLESNELIDHFFTSLSLGERWLLTSYLRQLKEKYPQGIPPNRLRLWEQIKTLLISSQLSLFATHFKFMRKSSEMPKSGSLQ